MGGTTLGARDAKIINRRGHRMEDLLAGCGGRPATIAVALHALRVALTVGRPDVLF